MKFGVMGALFCLKFGGGEAIFSTFWLLTLRPPEVPKEIGRPAGFRKPVGRSASGRPKIRCFGPKIGVLVRESGRDQADLSGLGQGRSQSRRNSDSRCGGARGSATALSSRRGSLAHGDAR